MPVQMRRVEFIALMAMLSATVAFSIDAMLPSLPDIGAALSPEDVNRAQLVVTSFVLGMGVGTLFTGPISDRFGRKPVMIAGVVLYIASALVAASAQSLELLLAARVAQGLGASGPRVVAMAVVRDLYAGRGMARIVSFIMVVFTLVPAIAPSLGAMIIAVAGWRAIFWCFVLFALVSAVWLWTRLPETLAPADRRPIRIALLWGAMQEMARHPAVRISILAQCLCFGILFSMLSTTQQIFDVTFGHGDSFALWFGGIAVVAGSSGFLNAALVVRLGMRFMVTTILAAQVVISAAVIVATTLDLPPTLYFAVFVLWQTSVFFMAGMTIGNLNAMGLEPMGHIAGMAASVMSGISTVTAVMLAAPVGLMFDGTPRPLAIAICTEAFVALLLMDRLRKIEARAVA